MSLLGSVSLAARPALVFAIGLLLQHERGDRAALMSLGRYLRTLPSNDLRCAVLTADVEGATTLRAGVERAVETYRGRSDADADAWLNVQMQRVAPLRE